MSTVPIPHGLEALSGRALAAAGGTLMAAESLATVGPIIGSIVVAVLALAGSVFAATTVLRQSTASNLQTRDKMALDRDQQHDARVEAENTRLRADLATMMAQRDETSGRLRDVQELHARLRLAVIAHSLDPDEIISPRRRGPDDAAA